MRRLSQRRLHPIMIRSPLTGSPLTDSPLTEKTLLGGVRSVSYPNTLLSPTRRSQFGSSGCKIVGDRRLCLFIMTTIGRSYLQNKQQTSCTTTLPPTPGVPTTPSTPLADDDPLLTLRYRISLDHLLTSSHCGLFSFHSLHLSHSLLAADIHPDLTTIFSYFIFIFTFIHHVLQRVTVRRATTCTHEYPCAYKGTIRTSAFSSS